MMRLEIIYWRDIPAQCVFRAGRKKHGIVLPERFERAIDRCAMLTGLKECDDYLAQWRRSAGKIWNGTTELPAALEEVRAMMNAQYPNERLHRLIEQKGFEIPVPEEEDQEIP